MKTVKMLLWMTVLTGILYPLLITLIAQTVMKEKAQGSLIGDKGSLLIAQKFVTDRYFWPRPSAVDYNPLPSGGSNLGPISPVLQKLVRDRKELYKSPGVPSELLYASGSGLDPHISPQAAYFQIERVAKARNLDVKELKVVIDMHTKKSLFGPLCVNVLSLNLALDEIK